MRYVFKILSLFIFSYPLYSGFWTADIIKIAMLSTNNDFKHKDIDALCNLNKEENNINDFLLKQKRNNPSGVCSLNEAGYVKNILCWKSKDKKKRSLEDLKVFMIVAKTKKECIVGASTSAALFRK